MLARYQVADVDSLRAMRELVPELTALLFRGRVVSADEPPELPVMVNFLPEAEVLDAYRKATGKIVYVVRDPRDIMISAARALRVKPASQRAFGLDFIAKRGVDQLSKRGLGTWQQHVTAWTSPRTLDARFPHADLLTVRYEDMRADPAATLGAVVEFLGLDDRADPERVSGSVEGASLERMRAMLAADGTRGVHAFRDKPGRELFFGQGLCGQSLTVLGDDVASAYARAAAEDEDFGALLRRFGYTT
jgi:hypothetical protein